MKEFIKKYWKKHLLLYCLCFIVFWMMVFLEAYEGMIFFVVMCFVATIYIILRDADRFDNLNKNEQDGK